MTTRRCADMDPDSLGHWTKHIPTTPKSTIQQHQTHLPIKLGGYGIHSYTTITPAAHITSWVACGQTPRTVYSKHAAMKPQSVGEAIREFEEHTQADVNTLRRHTWIEVLTGVTTKGMQRVLTVHSNARHHKHVSGQAATHRI